MKKSTVAITYDDEKLSALMIFLTQKDVDLTAELVKFVDQLFLRNVPANVREYISKKQGAAVEKAK
jgi:predicted HAD superfamily phosphohydrolase